MAATAPTAPATGAPTIIGTLKVDEIVRADTSGIEDADGLSNVSFSYEWIRYNGNRDEVEQGDIEQAYRLLENDQGERMKVRVSFTDDAGNSESLTSEPTALVKANTLPTSGPFSLASAGPLTLPNTSSPAGIWSDGSTMWVATSQGAVHAYDLATWQRQSDRDIPVAAAGNNDPQDLWSDGSLIWVSDSNDAKIYAYDLTSGERRPDRDFDDNLSSAGNSRLSGIWSDGTTIWVGDRAKFKIYAYDLATGERRADREIDSLWKVGNVGLKSLWSDGVIMWVLDDLYDRIYAYDLATGNRKPELGFGKLNGRLSGSTTQGSSSPTGIWSDGATMWVTDSYQFKVFAYNMPELPLLKTLHLEGVDFEFVPWMYNYRTGVIRTTATTTVSTTPIWSASSTVDHYARGCGQRGWAPGQPECGRQHHHDCCDQRDKHSNLHDGRETDGLR